MFTMFTFKDLVSLYLGYLGSLIKPGSIGLEMQKRIEEALNRVEKSEVSHFGPLRVKGEARSVRPTLLCLIF